MRIAIIGAGFTGLAAGFELARKGHRVTIFEKESLPGGLAIGYQEKGWEWTLEKHYHHWFTNDKFVLDLAREIGHEVLIKRSKTSVYVDKKTYQFDSPKKVLLFPKLSLVDRLRMTGVIGLLRYNPFWEPLEKINASTFLAKTIGEKAYKMIWEPQLLNKFGPFANNVSLAWFWARITKRTSSLAYPTGGFLDFANHLVASIKEYEGAVHFNTEVIEIASQENIKLRAKDKLGKIKNFVFDKVIFTLPSSLFLKIAPQLPEDYKNKLIKLKGLGATNLILRLSKPFFPDKTYWLSVCDRLSPVMAIVEHTNFMDKTHYNNEHLVYLGNYLPSDSERFALEGKDVLQLFDPFLSKINPHYKEHLIDYQLFKASFAQPIIPTNYSKMIPPMTTPLKNVLLANIEQVYPWDRGTNYAVELGQKVAKLVINTSKTL